MVEPHTKVWIPISQDEWHSGEVVATTPSGVKCLADDGEREFVIPQDQLKLQNPSLLDGVDDMTTLSYLHEPAVLHNLETRCALSTIYTYTGTILIALNPYCKLSIYGKEMIDGYCGQPVGKLPPHVYAVAENTYRDMLTNGTNQSILVSGESGAGKTETTKFLLSYFAAMAEKSKYSPLSSSSSDPFSSNLANALSPPLVTYSPTSGRRSPNPTSSSLSPNSSGGIKSSTGSSISGSTGSLGGSAETTKANIETQVLESTPILEAFGNAKTLRNDNSSRFGKWSEIQFDSAKGTIVGAKIRTYLLEKSRIVKPPEGERNYHIFYQLLAGTSPEERKKFGLDKLPNSEEGISHAFHYLQQSSCHTISDVNDGEMFRITKRALSSLGFTEEEGRCVWSVLAASLHLGNITFEIGGKNDEGKVMESSGYNPVAVVSSLLAVDLEILKKVLTTRKMVAGNETYTIPMPPHQCSEARDSLAMLLYSRLFDWLVLRINQAISNPAEGLSFIGVLDIYGFEFFETNSFEQFTINYANEKLQQQFNQQIFKLEQNEYTKEKIDWSYIQFHDNQDCVDLIEKKPICILTLLDEETQFPKATSQTLATKLYNNLLGKSKHFEKPRFSNIQFTVDHYAGKVTYDTTSFLEKNKDFVVPEQVQMLEKSNMSFIKGLLPKQQQVGGGAKGKSSFQFLSVASQFRDSLANLMDSIHQTQPNYIRCIKPNANKKPLTFDKVLVLQQLRCGGVLEQLRISRAGYPSRLPYANVMRRYKLLAVKQLPPNLWNNPKKCCEILMNTYKIGIEQVQFGLTKLFLRAGVVAQFESMRTQKLSNSAIAVQKHWKRFYYQRRYKQLRIAAIYVQNCMRKGIARTTLGRLREDYAATKLQCAIRKQVQVKKYNKIRHSAVTLQKAVRSFYAARKFAEMKLDSAVTILQTAIRRAAALRWRSRLVHGVVKAQARWRAILARRLYREMKIEARQLSTVIAEKNKLEKKAEELQWRLSAEAIVKQKLEEDNKKLVEKAQAAKDTIKARETEASYMADRLAALEAQVAILQKQVEREKAEKEEQQKKAEKEHAEVEKRKKEAEEEREAKVKEREEKERVEKELEVEREEKKKLQARVEELEAEVKTLHEKPKLLRSLSVVAEFARAKEAANAPPPTISLEPVSPPTSTSASASAATSPVARGWQPTDNFTDEQIEVQNRNEPLKTALAIGGNEVDSGKFLVDMVIAARGDDGPSQFVSGIPEPSFVIFKFLLRRELVPCKVDQKILNYLIDSFASALQVSNTDNDKLSFWMSNIAFLTYMVGKEVKKDNEHQVTFAADVIFHSTISQFHYGSPPIKREASTESQSMANSFFNHLQTLLVKIYTCLFRNVTSKISPLLHEALFKQNASIEKMEQITNYLTHVLSSFQQNFVYLDLVEQFFEQIFFYMNCVIFNEILLRRDLNSLVRGLDLKMKIAELESWAASSAKEWIGTATQQLKHAQQTISILMINKTLLENQEIRQEICPDLTAAQVAQLLSLYTPDPDSFEEPIPVRVRQAILRSSTYHPDDRLLLDPAVLRPFPLAILHYLELRELDRIPYSSTILVTALMKMNISNKMPKVASDDKVARVRSWSVKLKGSKG